MKYRGSKFKPRTNEADNKAMKLYSCCVLALGLALAHFSVQARPLPQTKRNQKLFNSLAQGDALSVRVHLTKGALPIGIDSQGRNALHLAAGLKDAKLLTKFIDNKALPINAVDHRGQSPLFEAVEAGHLPSVKLLEPMAAAWICALVLLATLCCIEPPP